MSAPLRPGNRPAPRTQASRPGVEIIQPVDYVDRRSEPRMECDDRGALLYLANNVVIECRILDQSPSGARVAFDNVGNIPSEIWLIDLDTNLVRLGTSAWSTPTRMGLKFSFIQTLMAGQARPAKVPVEVYDTWLRLSGNAPAEAPKTDDSDDVLFLD